MVEIGGGREVSRSLWTEEQYLKGHQKVPGITNKKTVQEKSKLNCLINFSSKTGRMRWRRGGFAHNFKCSIKNVTGKHQRWQILKVANKLQGHRKEMRNNKFAPTLLFLFQTFYSLFSLLWLGIGEDWSPAKRKFWEVWKRMFERKCLKENVARKSFAHNAWKKIVILSAILQRSEFLKRTSKLSDRSKRMSVSFLTNLTIVAIALDLQTSSAMELNNIHVGLQSSRSWSKAAAKLPLQSSFSPKTCCFPHSWVLFSFGMRNTTWTAMLQPMKMNINHITKK